MGSACPSCERDMDTQDDQPRLCAKHIQKKHPNDNCPKCGIKFKDHKLIENRSSRTYNPKFECEFR